MLTFSFDLQDKKEGNGEEPPPKRPRGRPPKNPKSSADDTGGEGGEPREKKKRGRPPKKAAA